MSSECRVAVAGQSGMYPAQGRVTSIVITACCQEDKLQGGATVYTIGCLTAMLCA